ncbi:MAG: YadA-like family protein, partial [Veillonella sp.]|nr:YadA-like family protein [Veillonella sp.]
NANANLNNRINKLDKQIGKVGAGAAALAGLHPVDFDPDYKFNVAVAGGAYKGEQAMALGAFYRPNDNIMFSVGSTVGNDENMYNVGASFKFGTSAKKVKDADLKDMQRQIDELKNMVNNLANENKALRLSANRAGFPDVPADHWAAEAVETLHGNDVLAGYPDGNFHGDKPMTRYEYAQMLYKTAEKI